MNNTANTASSYVHNRVMSYLNRNWQTSPLSKEELEDLERLQAIEKAEGVKAMTESRKMRRNFSKSSTSIWYNPEIKNLVIAQPHKDGYLIRSFNFNDSHIAECHPSESYGNNGWKRQRLFEEVNEATSAEE